MDIVKITQPGFEGYTGFFGQVEFKDGVSVEPLTQRHVDQIGALVSIVIVTADGSEVQGGAAARLVGGATQRAPEAVELPRQTEDERIEEHAKKKIEKGIPPSATIYTQEELETIASTSGIAGLRPIGKVWSVKGRAIPELIIDILKAQAEFQAQKGVQMVSEQAATAPAAPVVPGIEKPAEQEKSTEVPGEGA